MISAFTPILDSFVVAGTSESQIEVMQFLLPDSVSAFSDIHAGDDTREFSLSLSGITRPSSTTVLGKCSHWPVNDIAHMDESVAAVSASTLSTWDLVKNHRVRHLTTPDHVTTCEYVGPRLLAAAGHGRLVHLYDMRLLTLAQKPAWTVKIATDNLYTMAVDECTVFTAGADGYVYGVDLRAQHKYRWDLQPNLQILANKRNSYLDSLHPKEYTADSGTNAVLDLKVSKDHMFVTLESGQLCGIPRQMHTVEESLDTVPNNTQEINNHKKKESETQGDDYLFATNYLSTPVKTKIGCHILDAQFDIRIAVGSEQGFLSHYKYEPKNGDLSLVQKINIGSPNDDIFCVRWAPRGLYVNMGSTLNLLPYSHVT